MNTAARIRHAIRTIVTIASISMQRKALMLTATEQSELCEYLKIAQQAMLEIVRAHEQQIAKTPMTERMRTYASSAADWRKRIGAL
jgi:hypothetical protein